MRMLEEEVWGRNLLKVSPQLARPNRYFKLVIISPGRRCACRRSSCLSFGASFLPTFAIVFDEQRHERLQVVPFGFECRI